jgi:hypothetical protein
MGGKRLWPNVRYPGIWLEEQSKSSKHFIQNNRPPDRDVNPGPPEYKAGVLTICQQYTANVK